MAINEAALRKDYYKVLGLERGRVTDGELKRAFKDMILKYDPEKTANNERVQRILQDIQAVPFLYPMFPLCFLWCWG